MLDRRLYPRKAKVSKSLNQFFLGRLADEGKNRVSLTTVRKLTHDIDLLFYGIVKGVPALRDVEFSLLIKHG
jgi:hypothetical protein